MTENFGTLERTMKNINSSDSFGHFLKKELERQKNADPSFSLRRFAATLGIEPSFLSKLIHGKRSVSSFMLEHIGLQVGLSPRELANFQRDLHEQKKVKRPGSGFKSKYVFKPMVTTKFEQISEWYYFAILEMALIEDFQFEHTWIAEQLGISRFEAKEALNKLKKLGFFYQDKNGQWAIDNLENSVLPKRKTTIDHQRLQRQFLSKAIDALSDYPVEVRDQSGVTMAIPADRVDKMKKLIKTFRKNAANLLRQPGKKTAVYQLSISFFPLVQMKGKGRV